MKKIISERTIRMEEIVQRISLPVFIQLAIECWNGIFLLIMIFSLLFGKYSDKRSNAAKIKIPMTNEIIIFFIAILFYNLFDVTANIHYADTTESGFLWYSCSVFCYYLVGAFQTLFFLQLVKIHIAKRNNMRWLEKLTTAVQCLHIPCIALLAATPFTRSLYWFSEYNKYVRGDLYPIWYYATMASFLYIIVIIIILHKRTDPLFLNISAVAAIIPLIAFIITFVNQRISFNNISVSITALIIFVLYEKNRSVALVKSMLEAETVKRQLAESKLELERSKNTLLMAQIQPHFITNSLMALRARCADNPEVYESLTNFSRYLRSNFEALGEVSLISFEKEMQNIEAYLALEKDNFGDRLNIVYDIAFDGFLVPALSVQPLVENAVRHGVGTYDKGGTVLIRTYRDGDNVVAEVTDDGSGKSNITEKQKDRKGIGIKNVQSRLESFGFGRLEIFSSESGTTARITLTDPKLIENEENGNNN